MSHELTKLQFLIFAKGFDFKKEIGDRSIYVAIVGNNVEFNFV